MARQIKKDCRYRTRAGVSVPVSQSCKHYSLHSRRVSCTSASFYVRVMTP